MKFFKLTLFLIFILLLSACQNSNQKNEVQINTLVNTFTYEKYDIDVSNKVFLGDKNAEHTIILAFDYSCPWCKKWMLEVLPEIQTKYLDNGIAKYIGQPLALLNKNSLFMAEADQIIETSLPSKYYELQTKFASDSSERENGTWGNEEYLKNVFEELNLNYTEIFNKDAIANNDALTITRNYTKNYNVQYVPTIYVDGIKISDSFSLDEMDNVINGTIKKGDNTVISQ